MNPARQRGVGLVVVLWALVLLSAIAVSYAYTVRSEVRMTRNHIERAQAAALAEAAVARGLYEIAARPPRSGGATGGERVESLEGGEARWVLGSPAGRVDLNAAPAELLDRLLVEAVPGADRRGALVAAIQDWRDADSLTRIDGAEDRDYLAAGAPHGAADRPFQDPAELLQVLGMSREAYNRIAPHVTVHSGLPGVNPRHASRELLALLGAEPEVLDELMALRLEDPENPALSVMEVLPRALTSSGDGDLVLVRGSGVTSTGTQTTVEALARRPAGAGQAPEIVAWRPVYASPTP